MPGMTDYLRNHLLDWLLRGQSFTPPATVYIALCVSAPTAASPGSEVSTSGTGYARIPISSSLSAWSSTDAPLDTTTSDGTTGTISNNNPVTYGTAAAAYGTVSHWEAWSAVTGGNRLFWGTIVNGAGTPTPRYIDAGDPVAFPASALVVNMT